MPLTGKLLIGSRLVAGTDAEVLAYNPADGSTLQPPFLGASAAQTAEACDLAWAAFDSFRDTRSSVRADFLDAIAENILGLGDALIERAAAETGLPPGRLTGERGRTIGQLRQFAELVRSGDWIEARIDTAMPDRQPLARSDLRQRQIGLGPVAVFGASNFPLAFSVAGGDTAAALAAGCPVVVKAHSAHLGTSELVGRAIQAAVAQAGLHEGVFSMLLGAGVAIGQALASNPAIKAVGFTGSRAGGLALMAAAASRPEPIPVYAEMSSINPMVLLPAALAARPVDIANGYVASLTLGAGQFCTNPGLVLAVDGPGFDAFIEAARASVTVTTPATMLTAAIHREFTSGLARLAGHPATETLASGAKGGPNQSQAHLFSVQASDLIADTALQGEVFGPASVVVRCASLDEMTAVLESLEGQLTITLQIEDPDLDTARGLRPILERKAGRILINGYPTGVEVSPAMVHGGPFPATSDGRSTSVGTLAIRRFLRPVCYQDFPQSLLPSVLTDSDSRHLERLVDGRPMAGSRNGVDLLVG